MYMYNVLQLMFHRSPSGFQCCSVLTSVKCRGFPRAVSEPVVSVSELDWYTSCILSVTDTCLYRNNRVISPGDIDILYNWFCILVSSWNPANTSGRWYQMRKAKDWNWDLNKSFSNIPRKMFFLIISWMHIKYTISILHITIRQIWVKIILKNKKKMFYVKCLQKYDLNSKVWEKKYSSIYGCTYVG